MLENEEEPLPEPTTELPSVFSNLVNVISGARQVASQEFTRFWENIGHATHLDRKIITPKRLRSKQDIFPLPEGYGRILPDLNRRSLVRDAESQTDTLESQFSVVHRKRKNDEELDRQSKFAKREAYRLEHEESLSSVAIITKNAATSPEGNQFIIANDDIISNEEESSSDLYKSFSNPNDSPLRRDIVTGNKSVRRLTLELEEILSHRTPVSSPSKQRPVDFFDKMIPASPIRFGDCSLSSPTRLDKSISTSPKRLGTSTGGKKSVDNRKNFDERMEELEQKFAFAESQIHLLNEDTILASPKTTHVISSSSVTKTPPIRSAEDAFWTDIKEKNSPLRNSSSRERLIPSLMKETQTTPPLRESPLKPNQMITPSSFRYSNTDSPGRATLTMSLAEKPNDRHKSKMRELIQIIPTVKLKKTDTIIGADGVRKPNPFWNEIYGSRKRVY